MVSMIAIQNRGYVMFLPYDTPRGETWKFCKDNPKLKHARIRIVLRVEASTIEFYKVYKRG